MTTDTARAAVDLEISGMTCTACAMRIEKRLNRLDGVDATVNFALERAHVLAPIGVAGADVLPALIGAVEQAGYTARLPAPLVSSTTEESADDTRDARDHGSADDLRRRVVAVGVLAVPVIALGMVPALQFRNWQWLSLMLAFPIATWGAWPFHRVALANLRHRAATMDTLVSLGVVAAFAWSFWALFWGSAAMQGMHDSFSFTTDRANATSALYFEVVAATTLFLLSGRWFEAKARRRGGDALRSLAMLGAREATRLRADGSEELVPIEALAVGDRFVTKPGEKVATDGVVLDGHSAVDASLVTGESVPVDVGPGDHVTGATVNAGGRLVVRAERVGSETTLARIAQLVADAQSGKAPIQRLADRIAGVFVPAVILLSLGTLAWWWAQDGFARAVAPGVAVLIVACPCALGLATPMALLIGTGRGAQLGILISGPQVLEATRRIDTVVLDKTGTITAGRMSFVDLVVDDDRQAVLQKLASLEAASEHPIAMAIAATLAAGERRPVTDFRSTAGLGVEGVVDGVRVRAGRRQFVEAGGHVMSPSLAEAHAAAEAGGKTAIVVGWDGRVRGVAIVADEVRPTSAAAIHALRELGVRPVLVTGDNDHVAAAVAAEVGIAPADVVAGVLPAGKVDVVRDLQAKGHVVAVVGDGVNDAAALATADLGVAMGSGTDAAMNAADLTLVRSDLGAAVDAVRLSRRTLRTIKGNLVWAFGYNVAALPVAAAGLLNPMLAGLAMAFSSVFVVINSLRLARFNR